MNAAAYVCLYVCVAYVVCIYVYICVYMCIYVCICMYARVGWKHAMVPSDLL